MPIHDRPLLEIWIALFERHGIDSVLINTHHHAAQVEACVAQLERKYAVDIVLSYEKTLLGSGGTLFENRSFVEKDDDFVIAYADNLTNVHLGRMIESHISNQDSACVLTMGLFHASNPEACGIALLNAKKQIVDFVEKPAVPKSDLANAGIYVTTHEVFDFFPEKGQPGQKLIDLGHHVLPQLAGRMAGYEITEYIRDIGTVASFHAALAEWPQKA